MTSRSDEMSVELVNGHAITILQENTAVEITLQLQLLTEHNHMSAVWSFRLCCVFLKTIFLML